MSTNDHDDEGEWDEKSDLTRIEDLSEFLHEEDPDVDAQLMSGTDEEDSPFSEDTLPDIPEAEDLSSLDDLPKAPQEEIEENYQEESFDSNDHEEVNFGDDFDDNQEEVSFGDDTDDAQEEEQSFGDDFEDAQEDEQSFGDDFENAQEDEQSLGDDFDDAQEDEQSFGDDFDNAQEDEQSFEGDPLEEQEEEQQIEEQSFDDDSDNDQEEEQSFDDNLEEESLPIEEPPAPIQQDYSAPPVESPQASVQRENFQDLRDFGNAITYGVVTTGGNPPFSLILRGVKYQEDAEDIKILLREHGLLTDESEQNIDQGLEQGSLLISQISEYSAIYLAHKMRRFDVDIRIGLSDQLHPSKSYEREERGLISKDNLRQNREEFMEIEDYALNIEDIKMVTSSQIEGYSIKRYIEIVSAHSLIKEADLYRHSFQSEGEESAEDDLLLRNLLEQFPQEENPIKDLGLNEVYQILVDELRNEAFKVEANAVVGINFNITPITTSSDNPQTPRYKITATGNAVWIIDQPY